MGHGPLGRQAMFIKLKKKKPFGIISTIAILILAIVLSLAIYLPMSAAILTAEDDKPFDLTDDPELGGQDPLTGDDFDDPNADAGLQKKEGVTTFIVGGTDKDGTRTDTIMLVRYDTTDQSVNILQIPRDTYLNTTKKSKKANALYAYGKGTLMKDGFSNMFGFEIDYYVVINFTAFNKIIDKIGGVEVDVPIDMDYDDPAQDLHIHIKKGKQVLKGDDAIGFVRFRKGYADADIGRMKAQKMFITAAIKKVLSPGTIVKIPSIITDVFANVKTDMQLTDMLGLAANAVNLDMDKIRFFSLPGEAAYSGGVSYYSVYLPETLELINQSFNPYTTEITEHNMVELARKENNKTDLEGSTATEIDEKRPTFYPTKKSSSSSSSGSSDKKTDDKKTETGKTPADGGDTGTSGTEVVTVPPSPPQTGEAPAEKPAG